MAERSNTLSYRSNLNATQAAIVKLALSMGYYQHRVAAFFGVNQGRISEIKSGKVHAGVVPALALPSGFPML